MNVFKKIGGGFKWVGKKLLGVLKRNEILIAAQLAANFLPIPALDKAVSLVWAIDGVGKPGKEKMKLALKEIIPLLNEFGVETEDEADLRFIIELCLQIVKGKARVITE